MGKNLVRVTSNKEEAIRVKNRLNKMFEKRKINRIAYVTPVSQSYVKTLTRAGYPVRKKNYAVAVKNK